jgi:hypothetical protein
VATGLNQRARARRRHLRRETQIARLRFPATGVRRSRILGTRRLFHDWATQTSPSTSKPLGALAAVSTKPSRATAATGVPPTTVDMPSQLIRARPRPPDADGSRRQVMLLSGEALRLIRTLSNLTVCVVARSFSVLRPAFRGLDAIYASKPRVKYGSTGSTRRGSEIYNPEKYWAKMWS